ncbi:MAG: riboflavin biosynthesis protein RibF [Phycisphaerales bacterium]
MPMTAITIGNFDGVHLGHQALVARCRTHAGSHGRVLALAFDPHPNSLLNPSKSPVRLTTFEQRIRLLRAAGADEVIRLEPSQELLDLTPRQFFDRVIRVHDPRWVVEGDDFRFGKGRTGGIGTLASLGEELGFNVDVVEPFTLALGDHLVVKASSTLVRWLLDGGRVNDAALVLGRPYTLRGAVVRGDRRGRTIGFPTANLAVENATPMDGVYAAAAVLPGGARFPCMLNVGTRPTFDGVERRVEAHLIGAPSEEDRLRGLPEYGWELSLELVAWLRDQVRFSGVDRLIEQLSRDRERARWHLRSLHHPVTSAAQHEQDTAHA